MPDTTSKIIISDWEIPVSIGIYDFEKAAQQPLIFTLVIGFMAGVKFTDDDINTTLNYEQIIETIKNCCNKRHYNLLEHLAETLCSEILSINHIHTITLKIDKPGVLKNERSGLLGIEIKRSKTA